MITESAVLVRKEEVIYYKYVTVDEVPLLTYLRRYPYYAIYKQEYYIES